jgi:carboxyl-terminal processing protease
MLVGALDFLQRDVPEILIDRYPERDPKQVKVRVGGQEQTFNIERVDSPWTMRGVLQDIFKFVQPNLQPVTGKEDAKRLLEVEIAAANGMLYTLDPHSVLLDVESFKDMRTQTQGKFGGLGIVINLDRKGRLYVVRPMPETPAIRAGIKAKDRIVRINNESTMNMTREEAVERLRGDVGSSVDVYVERTGVEGMKKFPIVRDMIRPPAIENVRVLNSPVGPAGPGGKVGYFRISQFNANTERDLMEALSTFEKDKVKGIIMDLRANPGGLYDQAQKVADAFIDSGVLVSMVGVGGSQRKDEHASRNGNVKVPLAVLVNQLSASASEIVAGAVKNLDRGVVIGETTFGKGSVQMLFDIPSPVSTSAKGDDDRLGLKLTTAQYLTPGDLSIQGVGVTPDLDLVRLRVQKTADESMIQLQRSNHRRQESDYEWHLDHPSAQKGTKPAETLSYLFIPSAAQEKREQSAKAEDDDDDAAEQEQEEEEEDLEALEENIVDFPMEFARDLLANTKSARRREMLQGAKSYLDKVRADEDKKLSQALEKLSVDWNPGPANPAVGQVQVSLTTPNASNKAIAGEVVKIRGTVKNVGTAPVHRVHALLSSENPYFDENEMVFGKIAPGESKSFDLNVKVSRATLTRTDAIRANVFAQGQLRSNTPELTLNVEGKARPLFAYSYQTVDDVKGNNDGRVQLGEKVRLLVKVKNIGQGAAVKTEGLLRNGPGQQGILISAGRFEGKDLAAGASKTFAFIYEIGPEFRGEDYTLELMVGDSVLGESVTDKIKIKVARDNAIKVEPATGTATAARADVALREAPTPDALLLGKTAAGAAFKVTGKSGAFTRVELEPGRPAFVATSDLRSGGAPKLAFNPAWQVMPPVLAVKAPSVVDGSSVTLKGQVTDDVQVKDLFVRVYNKSSKLPAKKVYYLPNRGEKNKLPFQADVPLWPGSNIIQVFARETTEVQSVVTLIVMRKSGPSVAQAPIKDGPGSATGTKPAIRTGRSGMTTR